MAETSRKYLPIHLVVFLAGFTFLVYEVSWTRQLSLVLGATVSASTIVLSSFMAGFGYGALFWGRRAVGQVQLGRMLGVLVVGMGAASALDFFLFRDVIPHLYKVTGEGTGVPDALMFVLAALLLFLPAFLMGGVFPVASRLATQHGRAVAQTLGRLYAAETLGSALGGLMAGFILLGSLGQFATIFVAVGLNVLLGVWVFLDQRFQLSEPPEAGVAEKEKPTSPRRSRKRESAETTTGRPDLLRAALIGAFVCGFALLTLQVLWLRMFRVYLTNTSYTFALISSLSILGIFVGSALFQRRSGRLSLNPDHLVGVLIYMMATVFVGLVLMMKLPQTLMFPFEGLLADPVARVLGLPFLAALLIVFPPAVGSGYAFPLACSLFTTSRSGVSGDVGFVMMINTIGSVVGPVIAAFILIPTLGVVLSVTVVLAWLAIGAVLILRGRKGHTGQRAMLMGVAVIALVMVIAKPEIRILPPSFLKFDRKILHYDETVEGTLAVGKDRDTRSQAKYTFVNNSAVIGSSYDAIKVVKMVGHYPFLMGADIKDVLVIGFGVGVTTSAIASHPEVEKIECVELVEGLKDAAVYYRQRNHDVVKDPRLNIRSGDGRHFLQKTNQQFDLISCDPTHPILGSGNLYTRDYFELCRDHLNEGGMVSQYLPLHKLRQDDLVGIMATFHEVFPHSSIWLGHYHAVLLGSNQPLDFNFARWSEQVNALEKDNDFYIDPHHLAATLLFDSQGLEKLGTGSGINTDNRSYTEFFDTYCLKPGNTAENLKFLHERRQEAAEVFQNIDDLALMERFQKGQDLLCDSLYFGLKGDQRRSLAALQEAARVNPEDGEFPFLIKLNF